MSRSLIAPKQGVDTFRLAIGPRVETFGELKFCAKYIKQLYPKVSSKVGVSITDDMTLKPLVFHHILK